MTPGLTKGALYWRVVAGTALLPALLSIHHQGIAAQTATEHPYIEADEINVDACLDCHVDKERGRFLHSAIEMGCETCHAITSENQSTSITLVAEGGELCTMCHEAKEGSVLHGPYRDKQCLTCHDPHTSDFRNQLRADVATLCTACHMNNSPSVQVNEETQQVALLGGQSTSIESYRQAAKIELDLSGASGHPVAGKNPRNPEVMLNCIVCHDPHASQVSSLLRQATESRAANENLCLGCHTDISAQTQKSVQHMALDMGGCSLCHTLHKSGPAGSAEGRFHLTQTQPDLCVVCHDVSAENVQKAHLGQPFATSRCSECHNPHGSEHAKLINNFVHPPFADKSCEICHSEPKEGKIVLNEGARRDLCLMCHADVQESIEKAEFVHAVIKQDTGCVSCHSPHAATYVHRTRRRSVELCLDCHTEQARAWRGKEYLHRPAFEISCAVCHHPHVGESRRRVRAHNVNDLCLECHGSQIRRQLEAGGSVELKQGGAAVELFEGAVSVDAAALAGLHVLPIGLGDTNGHPIPGHPVSGESISCLTCHNPHAADGSARRFVTETANSGQLCVQCHK